jgi:predicted Zn-dependent protease with MMP-like domain
MIEVSNDEFQALTNQALTELPGDHAKNIKNVAILYELEPTPEQRVTAKLQPYETLLGLYEGVPLSQRQGTTRLLPDKITLFKGPLARRANTLPELKESIKHTLWHEIAHYYGLNHDQIHGLE